MILATFCEIVWKLLHKGVKQKVIPPFLKVRGVPPFWKKYNFFLKNQVLLIKETFVQYLLFIKSSV